MNTPTVVALLLLVRAASLTAADQDWVASGVPTLMLTANVLSSAYCLSQPRQRSINVTLHVLLSFENTSIAPITIYRRPDTAYEFDLSSSPADLRKNRYLDRTETLVLVSPVHGFSPTSENPPQDFFVTLDPGEHYLLNSAIRFGYCRNPQEHCTVLPDGEYSVRAVYSSWPFRPELGKQLRHKWSMFGYLWLDTVSVNDLRFSLKTPIDIAACALNVSPAEVTQKPRKRRWPH